jgi:glutamate-1-semialdehyde 2,1-aminomutase
MFLCAAMTAADIDQVLDAAEGAFDVVKGARPALSPNARMSFLLPKAA